MRLKCTFFFICTLASAQLSSPLIAKARPTPPSEAKQLSATPPTPKQPSATPKRAELSPTLQALNGMMHSAIREAVSDERTALGPLILFEDGQMKLFRDDVEVAAIPASPPLVYHQLKVIGHSAFVTVIQLWRPTLTPDARAAWLGRFKGLLTQLQAELPSYGLPAELQRSQAALISHTLTLVERASSGAPVSRGELKRFARQVRPHLQAGFTHSARAHIDLIHQRTGELYAHLTLEERKQVRASFAGGRGARVGNLALQYVSWLIGERTGRESARVVFSEGVQGREKALIAFAQYGVERELAELIFDDPDALHRDVLGDATRAYLRSFPNASALFAQDPKNTNK